MKSYNLFSLTALAAGVFFVGCQKGDLGRNPPVVNAGAAQSIVLPINSVTLSGSAVDSGATIVSYLWSEVSGPNVPVIADEGSASSNVSGLIGGTYLFQLTATDNFGLTGAATVQVSVTSTPVTDSVVITANGTNSTSVRYIGGSGIDETTTAEEIGAEAWTINGNFVAVRSTLRFDLSSLPSTAIKSAKLSLYSNPTPETANLSTPNAGTANAFYIQRVSSSWAEGTATWANQPTVDSTGEVLIPQTNASSLDLIDVDVTTLVNNMIANANYGFEIRLQNEVTYNSRIFCSGTYADSTKHPRLVINY